MTTNDRDQRLAATFLALADTLVADFDMLDYLGLLAERAEELLDVDAAGVVLSDQRGSWRPVAASSEQAELLELFAAQTHEGPCQDCVTTGQPVFSADLSTDTRWPQFTSRAIQGGFQAAAALPMRLRNRVIGSLTLLNTSPAAVGDADTRLGQALADMATIGLLQQRAGGREELLVHQLQATLQHRITLEQASGVLAEHHHISIDHAYTLLRDHSRTHNTPLSDLAHHIADGTTDPQPLLANQTHHGQD